MQLHISKGNRKLGGKVANISLPPRATCNQCAGCVIKGCYAYVLYSFRPCVKTAWTDNWKIWKSDPERYETLLCEYLTKRKPNYFRWHVGGDIPNKAYWAMMLRLARKFPNIEFLAFTKQFDTIRGIVPKNLEVVLSAWPGLKIPSRLRRRFRVAWMRDHNNPDSRIPEDAIECSGNCSSCFKCWDLKGSGKDVVFHKH